MPKTRRERRAEQREHYLAGEARRPHSHTRTVRLSLEEAGSSATGVCSQCHPVLVRYADIFKCMIHQGSELIRRKNINPYPKRRDVTHYRDMNKQNQWLRENVFDSVGNYLYCSSCIRASLGISSTRLTRQRAVKRLQCQHPIVKMTKLEVEEKVLGAFVLMPADQEVSFKKWWRALPPTTTVNVRYPHERHGNSGRTSNSAKTTTMEDFLEFVDANSQPNGRSADSSGPTFYFSPKYATIQSPKRTVTNYEERSLRSVVGEFNRTQRERDRGECSNGSSHNWLKKFRPKLAICPHVEDYCDTCAKTKEEINGRQTKINRWLQSSNADPNDVMRVEDEIKSLKQALENHRQKAQKSHQYYLETKARCSSEWNEIVALEEKSTLSDDEKVQLAGFNVKFNLVLSADYQMQKLIPYWGRSAQPGSTYYLQKLNHDVFGIVNHASTRSAVYVFDERVGPKNTDHTVSYLTDYLSKLPRWITRVHLFLDNTSSTNKNFYFMAWAFEMVQQERLTFVRVSFLVAGHTKFAPDLLFSRIAQTYNRSDVFTTGELQEIISDYAEVVVDEGSIVCDWRNPMTKYSKLPGIRKLHDFIFVKSPVTNVVVAKVRDDCYTGRFNDATIHVVRGRDISECVIPDRVTGAYANLGLLRPLTDSKLKHLQQMYRDFVPNDRYLPFLSTTTS